MKKYIISSLVLTFVALNSLFANNTPANNRFNIIASNNSYIEFEIYPEYSNGLIVANSHSYTKNFGRPDVNYLSYPVFLPTDKNNRIDVLDAKYTDESNIEIRPVPTPKRVKGKKEWTLEYIKDENSYNSNSFYPSSLSEFVYSGELRNKYYGHALINPVQYNPVTKTARKYSYIRVRVTFGGNPLTSNRNLSYEEAGFLYYAAINSDNALNWSTVNALKQRDNGIQNSIFASGDFYKIEIKQTGIYKLDRSALQSAGLPVGNLDPRTIKIYGNNGAPLPYENDANYPVDPEEVAIYVEGESDGQFNDNDFVLFYGKSPADWKYDVLNKRWNHYLNPYSVSNYYFITFGGVNGKRMPVQNSNNNPGATIVTEFEDRIFENPEVNNLGATGTVWVSQRIDNRDGLNFSKELKGYVQGSNLQLRSLFGNGSSSSAIFEVKDQNSNFLQSVGISGIFDEFSHIIYYNLPTGLIANYSLNGTNVSRFSITLPSQFNSNTVFGYMDYFEIHYKRSLGSVENNNLRFTTFDSSGTFEYRLSGFSNSPVRFFNITKHSDVSIVNAISGTSNVQVMLSPGEPQEFIAIGGNNYNSPVSISNKIANQNIKGITGGASFLIISPAEFLNAANQLKAHRERPGPGYIKTEVVDVNKIYNEFSSGVPDPIAIKKFLRYAYENWNLKPVYALFYGDGSYDYKNIYNLNVKNFLPPIELDTYDQNEIYSYPSDDFFVELTESSPRPVAGIPDMAVGRINVNSLSEANAVFEKIVGYENPSNNGLWKKKIMYVADDGWTTTYTQGEEGALHTAQCETIAEQCTSPDFEKEKIYLVNYPAVITPQGRRKPGVNEAIIQGWNEGRLIINYVGHGSTDLWAHEQVFDRASTIPQLNNGYYLPLVTIASCDLARWDDPFNISAGEQLVNKSAGGGIGVIAATRPVYSGPNAAFNEELWRNMIFKKDTLHFPIRIGTAMFITKQVPSLVGDNTAKFTLIADPTLRVAIPQYFTKIDSINSSSGNDTAVIKALQKVTIHGSILNTDSTFWSNYNGDVYLKVFDVDRNVTVFDFNIPFNFRLDGGIIFNGRTQAVNGKWKIEFVVPRDISYNTGTGKMIAYFNNANSDGSGYTNKFILNGIDSNAAVDTTGPEISIFLGDRNFRSGDYVNQNTKIIADFFDENGMNLTGTIGHKIEAIINNNENSKIDLTPFYNSTSGYQYGSLEYSISNLSDGNYNLKIRAWDTYNNVNESQVDFNVISNKELSIENIYNFPNPMKELTSFIFQHNVDVPLSVNIKIYTVSGRLIKELNNENITDKFVKIDWDGKDADGDAIANGTYLYRLVVKSQDGSLNSNSTGKLAVLK